MSWCIAAGNIYYCVDIGLTAVKTSSLTRALNTNTSIQRMQFFYVNVALFHQCEYTVV